MKFYVLESGSKGNCTVVKGKSTVLVIDCGGTKKYIKEKFSLIGLDYQKADDHSRAYRPYKTIEDVQRC